MTYRYSVSESLGDNIQAPILKHHLSDTEPTAVAALSDAELIEQLLGLPQRSPEGANRAQQVREHIATYGMHSLQDASALNKKALTPTAKRRLALCLEFHKRLLAASLPDRITIRQPEDVIALMRPVSILDHERFFCLPLDTHSRLIGKPIQVSQGDIDGTDAGPRAFFRAALRAGAATVVAVHNHPSGSTEPSQADWHVTENLRKAGQQLDVELVDHIIIAAGDRYASLRRTRPHVFVQA